MSIEITLFTAFKVAWITYEFIGVFWRFPVGVIK